MSARCPYPGLRHFDYADREFYYGRDNVVDELVERLHASRFLALIGPSGCGKTSLIRAGLHPALVAGGLPDLGTKWKVIHVRPGPNIFKDFAKELVVRYPSLLGDHTASWQAQAMVLTELKRGPDKLASTLASVAADERAPLLLTIDPVRDLFSQADGRSDAAHAMLAQVLRAVRGPCPVTVVAVVAVDPDSLGECAHNARVLRRRRERGIPGPTPHARPDP